MSKIAYVQKRFSAVTKSLIYQANQIIGEYQKAGFDLTLRQLYYQFVARGLMAGQGATSTIMGMRAGNLTLLIRRHWRI
jgi:hypothetical protein